MITISINPLKYLLKCSITKEALLWILCTCIPNDNQAMWTRDTGAPIWINIGADDVMRCDWDFFRRVQRVEISQNDQRLCLVVLLVGWLLGLYMNPHTWQGLDVILLAESTDSWLLGWRESERSEARLAKHSLQHSQGWAHPVHRRR